MGLLPSVTFVTVQGGARWESILHSETYTPFFRSKTVRNGSGFGFGSEMLISRALLVYRVHLQLFRRGSIDVCERLPAFNPPGLLRLFIYHISALCMCVCVIPHPFPGQTSLSLLCSVHVQCRISNRLLLSSFLTATSRFEDRATWASGNGTKVAPLYRRIRFPAFCVVVFPLSVAEGMAWVVYRALHIVEEQYTLSGDPSRNAASVVRAAYWVRIVKYAHGTMIRSG